MDVRVTLSVSPELREALDALVTQKGGSRSAMVEVLLREHPFVQQEIDRQRGTGRPRSDASGRRYESVGAKVRLQGGRAPS